MTANAGMSGSAPSVAIGTANPEAAKYGRLWATEQYRQTAPGEILADGFLRIARPKKGSEVIDFGCGTGRGALMLAVLGGLRVTLVDFVTNCLDEDVRNALTTQPHALSFIKADLEHPIPVAAQYGYCTDVMEHVPPEKIARVLGNILRSAQHVFFSIATVDDKCGALIGEPLHLTVRPYTWWLDAFRQVGAVIHYSQELKEHCLFYVTAWATGEDVVKSGVLNEEEERIRANVRANLAAGWDQVHPHPTNDMEVMILGGGPSMPAFLDDIKAKRAAGVKLITLNGAYNWALEHGLTPSATCVIDARPFNARFTKPVVDGCKYLLHSGCDPSVFEGLPKDRTLMFHTMPNLTGEILTEHYGGEWHTIPGGSTVLLRAIPLLRMLGFTKFHLYGCDSCVSIANPPQNGDGPLTVHHAYAQPENEKDGRQILTVTVGDSGRIFYASGWMISQAQEFITLIAKIGDMIDLEVYGDGLLAHILATGAAMEVAG